MTRPRPPGSGGSLAPAEQARHWGLFVDWCVATRHRPLPASPATLAAFLTEIPVGPATAIRRIQAIDTAHRSLGLPAPGETLGPERPTLHHRHHPPSPPDRFEAEMVARVLAMITVGGWPAGIVGRRDAGIVALVAAGGWTRNQVRAVRADGHLEGPPDPTPVTDGDRTARRAGLAGLLERLPRAVVPGACPACGLSRWLRVAYRLERDGWRALRTELADAGEIPAAAETTHDCTRPLSPPTSGGGETPPPLFCAIDRHGVPQSGYPLSTRSITTIIATRFAHAETTSPEPVGTTNPARRSGPPEGVSDHDWGLAQRRAVEERLTQIDNMLDEAETHAEALLARAETAITRDDQTGQAQRGPLP